MQLGLLALGLVGWMWSLRRATRHQALPAQVVLLGSAAVLLASVVTPPSGSRDVWAYVMYGRLVAVHHEDPYVVSPAHVPGDPILPLTATGWRSARSVYGPLFVGVSTVGAVVSGDSPTRNRLFHQGLEAMVVVGALVALRRRSPDLAPLVLLGLSPPVAATVNSGHNDLLVGGLALAGVLCVPRGRHLVAGVLLAGAALVKIVAVLPAAALTVWVWRHHGRRAALTFAGAATTVVVTAYASVGGITAVRPLLEADHRLSRATGWAAAWPVLTRGLRAVTGVGTHAQVVHVVYQLAPLVLAGVLLLGLRLSGRTSPGPSATVAALAFVIAWPYVLPGYAMWALVVAAASPRVWPTRLAVSLSAALALAYVNRPGAAPTGSILRVLSTGAMGVAVVLWIALEVAQRTGRPRIRPSTHSFREGSGMSWEGAPQRGIAPPFPQPRSA